MARSGCPVKPRRGRPIQLSGLGNKGSQKSQVNPQTGPGTAQANVITDKPCYEGFYR